MSLKQTWRLYRRNGIFYIHHNETNAQESLRTRDRLTAMRVFNAKNEAGRLRCANRQIALAYLKESDPDAPKRTWQNVIELLVSMKHGETKKRWETAAKSKEFDKLRKLTLFETTVKHFCDMLGIEIDEENKPIRVRTIKVSTNVYLRRIHNFALDMNWLGGPIIPKPLWPKPEYKKKRAIKLTEHLDIVEREENPERKAFYQLAWHTGASQSDLAFLNAEDVDWKKKTISYARKKTDTRAFVTFGNEVAEILADLPSEGPLFPYLRSVRSGDRATEFKQRCEGLKIQGVTLHSYRYAWAQRARNAGMPIRFAQDALGHKSEAVALAYANYTDIEIPSLEYYEKEKAKAEGRG